MAVKHEGASSVSGKSDSIWDAYAASPSSKVAGGITPGDCGDHYHRYREDILLLSDMGMDAFRFSIAWTRIFPNETGKVNEDAVRHYNDVIDTLLQEGIEPHVTLWSLDHPQYLQDSYDGLLSASFVDDFVIYANFCFSAFGDRVKHWITMDEPNDYSVLAFASDQEPPGRCSSCYAGNSSTEPYIAGHNALLAHAAVAHLYRTIYQATQRGRIGIAIWFEWYEPLSESAEDVAAAERAKDFFSGWFLHPIAFGSYPNSMRTIVGSRLPEFTSEESVRLKHSVDFLGINIVTATYAYEGPTVPDSHDTGFCEDIKASFTNYRDGVPIGSILKSSNQAAVPWSMQRILNYVVDKYGDFSIYITENGWGLDTNSIAETLNDMDRIAYFEAYLLSLLEGIRDGAKVEGYFAWSLVDGFEYILGQAIRFGLHYVDESFNRYKRASSLWFQDVLLKGENFTYVQA